MATDSVTAPRPVRFSTAGLPDAERIARWEDHNAQALVGLRCRTLGEGILEATEVNLQLPHLHLARVRGTSHVVERPPEVIRRHPADAIAVYLTLVGEAFFYNDDGVRILDSSWSAMPIDPSSEASLAVSRSSRSRCHAHCSAS